MKTFKRILRVFLVIFCIVFANGCYYVFHGQFKSVEKLNQGKELNLYECCSIYTMHMGVWMFGWWIAPEAAYEAMLMHVPHKKDVVVDGFDMYAANGFSTEIHAKASDYAVLKRNDLRWALALNTDDTYFEVTTAYSMCIVPVRYTKAVKKIKNIPVNTSLFVYLQDKKLLFPYRIVYYYMYV